MYTALTPSDEVCTCPHSTVFLMSMLGTEHAAEVLPTVSMSSGQTLPWGAGSRVTE